MGLLDGSLDPSSMSALALAGGLLSPGSFGQGLSRGIAGSQQVIGNAQEMAIRQQQLLQSQLAYEKQMQMMNTMAPILARLQGGAAPNSAPGTPAMGLGAQSGSVGPTVGNAARMGQMPPQQSAPGFPMSFGDVTALKLVGGPDMTNDFKMGIEGVSHNPGSEVTDVFGNRRTIPTLDKGQALDGQGRVYNLPGFVSSSADLVGATKGAETRAVNAQTPIPLERLDRMPGLSPFATLGDLVSPPAGVAQGAGNSTLAANISADMRRTGTPTATVNGAAAGGFKSPADLAAEKIEAENAAKLRTEPAVHYATGTATGAVAEKTALDDRVRTGQDLMARINESRAAMENFKPGMGADAKLQVARLAQALGFPDDLVQRINGGDVSAKQEFIKLSAQTAMESLKQAMGGSGRITQAEFKVFQAANPNIELDPDAIKKIQAFATKIYQRDFSEQQARASYIENGGNPAQWSATWSRTLDPSGKGTPGANPLPANLTSGSLKVGATYVLPNGSLGKWDGFKFKGQ